MTTPITVHDLKIASDFFTAVWMGSKPFEVRKDDRGYKTHDVLLLCEVDAEGERTGRITPQQVSYVLRHDDFPEGVPEGYVVLGIRPVPVQVGRPE